MSENMFLVYIQCEWNFDIQDLPPSHLPAGQSTRLCAWETGLGSPGCVPKSAQLWHLSRTRDIGDLELPRGPYLLSSAELGQARCHLHASFLRPLFNCSATKKHRYRDLNMKSLCVCTTAACLAYQVLPWALHDSWRCSSGSSRRHPVLP